MWPEIPLMPASSSCSRRWGNLIEQNDARDNGLSYGLPQNVDVFDANAHA